MDKSPFGRLSPELRNRVYELALAPASQRDRIIYLFRREERKAMALTQVCRQIRSESRIMFFALNSFAVFCDNTYRDNAPLDILEGIGADALSQIKGLIIYATTSDDRYRDLCIIGGDRAERKRFEGRLKPWSRSSECVRRMVVIGAHSPVSMDWKALRRMGSEIAIASEITKKEYRRGETLYVRKERDGRHA